MRVAFTHWVAVVIGLWIPLDLAATARASDCPQLVLTPIFGASIPADGVFGFRSTQAYELPNVELRREATGDEVAVEVEALDGTDVLVVRPLGPLVVGELYTIALDQFDTCFGESVAWKGTLRAEPPGIPPLVVADVTVTYSVEMSLSDNDEVICCDRADFTGGDGSRCTSAWGLARLRADVVFDEAAPDPQGQIAANIEGPSGWILGDDGTFVGRDTYCVTPGAIHLVTEVRLDAAPICPDEALVAQLGEMALDPREILECARPFVICSQDRLSPRDCRHWSACECRSDGESPPLASFMLLAPLLRRRRRSATSGASPPGRR